MGAQERLAAALLNLTNDLDGICFPLIEEQAKEVAEAIIATVKATGGPMRAVMPPEGETGCVLTVPARFILAADPTLAEDIELGAALRVMTTEQKEDAALGAAWRAAEAALPERAWLSISSHPVNRVIATAHFSGTHRANASGPTPTAALIALTERLNHGSDVP